MKKKQERSLSNTKIAVVFFLFLGLIVGISLIIKLVVVVKQSQFGDSGKFNIKITNSKNVEVISLSPKTKSIAFFRLDEKISYDNAGSFLKIPIDGYISLDSLDFDQKINSLFLKSILNFNGAKTNLTIIDLLRILFFSQSVPESSIQDRNIASDLNPMDVDKIVGRLVSDELIEKENKTIQIINGTNVGGLGNGLARLVTNMGGNVMVVATADKFKKKSIISYIDEKTYTVERLQKALGYDIVKSSEFPVFDITIIIGEDKVNSVNF
ncbi:MAG: LytR C-terminal domain-containing protein [Candidatus Levybacteria bacterium]|nr:LytR C-terminal domain-containing protein [Candidatus Levybacteria bacterium]